LYRSATYGYGIAISGGLSNNGNEKNNHSIDSSIYVSDIVPGGPAQNKLFVDDKLLSVNGVNVENVEHSFVIRLLKEAKEFIHLVVKRKINNNNNNNNSNSNVQSIFNSKEALLKQSLNEITNTNGFYEQQQNTVGNRRNQAVMHTANTILANFNNNNEFSNINKR
jgi:hypothetical protein